MNLVDSLIHARLSKSFEEENDFMKQANSENLCPPQSYFH